MRKEYITMLLTLIILCSWSYRSVSPFFIAFNTNNSGKVNIDLSDPIIFRDYIAIDSNKVKYRKFLDSIETSPSIESILINNKTYYLFENDLIMEKNDFEVNTIYKEYIKYSIIDNGQTNPIVTNMSSYDTVGQITFQERAVVDITKSGYPITWDDPNFAKHLRLHHQLNFAIDKQSFRNDSEYKIVRDNFIQATKDWQKVCAIKFKYEPGKDTIKNLNAVTNQLTFVIKFENDANSAFVAYSFMTSQWINPDLRYVHVYPSYYSTPYNKIGVFRHEIGHIIGFKHEHIVSPYALCRNEYPEEWIKGTYKQITGYDEISVMHYVCPVAGSYQLKITKLDSIAADFLYNNR